MKTEKKPSSNFQSEKNTIQHSQAQITETLISFYPSYSLPTSVYGRQEGVNIY